MKNLKLLPLLALPFLGGARGQGCGPITSTSPAPSMTGAWAIAYDDEITVKIDIGGSIYDGSMSSTGGSLTITHQGMPITFDLDCSRPWIVCPSEVWPDTVTAAHKEPRFPHRFHVAIESQTCSGATEAASACGAGTSNPECDQVCTGTVSASKTEHFGVISEEGDSFDLLLGAGFATNGVNCGVLGVSVAKAGLETEGSASTGDWEAVAMDRGEVLVAYAGGCLWAGDPDDDGSIEALVIGAKVELRTGFTGSKK